MRADVWTCWYVTWRGGGQLFLAPVEFTEEKVLDLFNRALPWPAEEIEAKRVEL
jgi:hypothetical protein